MDNQSKGNEQMLRVIIRSDVNVNGDWDVTANSPLINQTARSICCNPNGTTCNTSGSGSGSATLGPQTSY